MLDLIGRLLSELHRGFPVNACPGDWAWAATVAGMLFALLPVVGAMLVAVTRHWIGNRYDAPAVVLIAVLGFVFVGALPLWAFSATSDAFRAEAAGRAVLDDPNGTLGLGFCFDGQSQLAYLGGAASVRQALGDLSGGGVRTVFAALVSVIAPLFALLFVYLQARVAFRRGPRWPSRLFWLPVLLLVLGTAPLSVSVTAHVWLGFAPAAMIGIIAVMLVGAPRWSVLNASGARRSEPPRPAIANQQATPYQQPWGPQPGQYAARPTAQASRPLPPTLVAGATPMAGPPGHAQPGPPAPYGPVPPPGGRAGSPPVPAGAAALAELPGGAAGPGANGGPGEPGRLAADPGPLPATLQAALAGAGAGAAAGAAAAASGPDGEETEPEHDVRADQTATLPSSRFQRIRRLGAGGFGQVWLAMDTKLGRTVAVKVATAHSAETEQRIQREARALAAVHHPNCVRIYDIVDDLDGGGLALVMEYVPGRPLGDVVRDNAMTDAQAARMWHTLAGALHAAHGKGVLHRDVKPSNIIVSDDGAPKLIDFGIARATGDVTLTAAGLVVGTPDFLPPEIAAGRAPAPASDAWQLAAVVSYALTGVPPRGHSDGAVAAMLAAARGEPCNQLPSSSRLRPILERALDPNPVARPILPAVQTELTPWLR